MDIQEEVALQIARDRIEDWVRAAEQMRAIRSGRLHQSARVRLGNALVRIGNWMIDHPSPARS